MLRIAERGTGAYHGGNVNSSRPGNEWRNPMQLEHIEKWTEHNRVNGAYCLWACGKNTGVDPMDILDDPSAAGELIARDYVANEGFDRSRRSVGANLFHALCSKSRDEFVFGWEASSRCSAGAWRALPVLPKQSRSE